MYNEEFMKRALELAKESYNLYGSPFGSVVVLDDKIIGEGMNNTQCNYASHAETVAMISASQFLNCQDLSNCILYTTCEPCPLCSFVAREYKIKLIVIGLNSPYVGGYTKWNILQDQQLSTINPFFSSSPTLIFNIMYSEIKTFMDTTLFGQYFGTCKTKIYKK